MTAELYYLEAEYKRYGILESEARKASRAHGPGSFRDAMDGQIITIQGVRSELDRMIRSEIFAASQPKSPSPSPSPALVARVIP
jgi:hypothetical protein